MRLLPVLSAALLTLALVEAGGRWALSDPGVLNGLRGPWRTGRRLAAQAQADRAVAAGADLFDRAGGGRLQYHPRWGWTARPGVQTAHGVTYTVSAAGRLTPAHDGLPWLLIGDSFTHGDEVGDADTWAWQLAEGLQAPVLNLGVPSFGLDQVALRLEDEVAARELRGVVVGVNALLITRADLDWDSWYKPRFTWADGRLVPPVLPVASPETAAADRSPFATVELLRLWGDVARGRLPDWSNLDHVAPALLDRIAATAGDLPLWVVYLPLPEELGRADGAVVSGGWRIWRSWCDQRHANCLDLVPAVQAVADAGSPVEQGAHWTPAVHAAVAAKLAETLPR